MKPKASRCVDYTDLSLWEVQRTLEFKFDKVINLSAQGEHCFEELPILHRPVCNGKIKFCKFRLDLNGPRKSSKTTQKHPENQWSFERVVKQLKNTQIELKEQHSALYLMYNP